MNFKHLNTDNFDPNRGWPHTVDGLSLPFKGGVGLMQPFDYPPLRYIYKPLKHNGLDLIPLDGNSNIYAVEGGEVVFADFANRPPLTTWKEYNFLRYFGIITLVWNKENNRLWLYAHLESNIGVEIGQKINRGDFVGLMGNTTTDGGISHAKHLHLSYFSVDSKCDIQDLYDGAGGGKRNIFEVLYNLEEMQNGPQQVQDVIQNNNSINPNNQNNMNKSKFKEAIQSLPHFDAETKSKLGEAVDNDDAFYILNYGGSEVRSEYQKLKINYDSLQIQNNSQRLELETLKKNSNQLGVQLNQELIQKNESLQNQIQSLNQSLQNQYQEEIQTKPKLNELDLSFKSHDSLTVQQHDSKPSTFFNSKTVMYFITTLFGAFGITILEILSNSFNVYQTTKEFKPALTVLGIGLFSMLTSAIKDTIKTKTKTN